MKKIIFLLATILVLAAFVAADIGESVDYTQTSKERIGFKEDAQGRLKIQDMRHDPLVASPGEYINIYLKLENKGGMIQDPIFELDLDYPFSLDEAHQEQSFPNIDAGEKITLQYKVKTDKNAIPDEYEVRFAVNEKNVMYENYYFEITVDNVITDFDVALQEVTAEGAAIAIANIGKNDAKSITVKIENQEDFELLGPGSHIIGNLNSGDYTILNAFFKPTNGHEETGLQVRIDYTDELGNRRTLYKEVPVFMSHQIKEGFKDLEEYVTTGDEEKGKSGGAFYKFTTVVLILVLVILYIRKRRRKAKS